MRTSAEMKPRLSLMPGVVIRAYGEYWDPDLVNWGRKGPGNKGTLDGKIGQQSVDVWEQRGIYVLHHDWRVVYVGRVTSGSLGARLRTHRSDWLAGRWDRFSWYGTRGIRADGTLSKAAYSKNVATTNAIKTMEALLISVAEGLNRSHERPSERKARNTRGRPTTPCAPQLCSGDQRVDPGVAR